MNSRLLGGWRHVADDVRRLAAGLNALPGGCACGQGAAHLAGMCTCCGSAERSLGACADCEALMASLRDRIDDLVDSTIRFLPFVEMSTAGQRPLESSRVGDLRGQVQRIAATFQKLDTAADEFRDGCTASHIGVLRELGTELAAATGQLDSLLEPDH